MNDIARRIKLMRRRADLSQADVAQRMKISSSAYGHWETGQRGVGVNQLIKLAGVFGCRVTDLLPESSVTDYDRVRVKDPRLDEIIALWLALSDVDRHVILLSARALAGRHGSGDHFAADAKSAAKAAS